MGNAMPLSDNAAFAQAQRALDAQVPNDEPEEELGNNGDPLPLDFPEYDEEKYSGV
jgi:hypothetical protein